MRTDENIVLDHDFSVIVFIIPSPIKMREDRGPKSDRDMIAYADPLGIHLIDINKLADPNLTPDLPPPHPVKSGPNTFTTRNNESHFMKKSIKKIPQHENIEF